MMSYESRADLVVLRCITMSYESRSDLVRVSCGSRNVLWRSWGKKLDKLRVLCYAGLVHKNQIYYKVLKIYYKVLKIYYKY